MKQLYRRLQRFFQHVKPDEDGAARLIVALLGIAGPWTLCLDRTNWKIGSTEANVLMLAVVTRRHRIPLMWTLLEHAGNSSMAQRVALMERYLAVFGAGSVKMLLADREFIGLGWMYFLKKNNVPFAIRLRANMTAVTEDGRRMRLSDLLRTVRGPRRIDVSLPGNGEHAPLAIVAIATAWSSATAAIIVGNGAPHRKAHGYFAKSWFRTGFDALRNRLRHQPDKATRPWITMPKMQPKMTSIV